MTPRRRGAVVAAFALLLAAAGAAACRATRREPPWNALFDGRSLAGWRESAFGGNGPIELVDGRLLLGQGSPLTGVTWIGSAAGGADAVPRDGAAAGDLPFPRDGYELELEAARLLGNDFFCALTFPVGGAHLTLVLGGWGGSLCGLSCLDGLDAAENETRSHRRFERGRSHRVRLRVAEGRVAAWLDGEPLVDVDTRGRVLSLRPEVEPSRPLGIATFATQGAIADVRWRLVPPERG